jgi:hypothetical protein
MASESEGSLEGQPSRGRGRGALIWGVCSLLWVPGASVVFIMARSGRAGLYLWPPVPLWAAGGLAAGLVAMVQGLRARRGGATDRLLASLGALAGALAVLAFLGLAAFVLMALSGRWD